jgi:hypothetical protein
MPQDTTGRVITGRDVSRQTGYATCRVRQGTRRVASDRVRDVSRQTGFATRHAEDDSGGGEGLGRELFVSGAHEHQDRFDQH